MTPLRVPAVVVAALALALACPFVTTVGVPAVAAASPAVDARKPPIEWDEAVADVAEFVEQARRLEFKDAVPVRFLSEKRFKREVAARVDDLSRREGQNLEQVADLLRALGLIDGGPRDFRDAASAFDVAASAAFYDPDEEEVVVRGKQLDLWTRVVVVHELTHALQDQYYDLEALKKSSGGSGAVAALVEGDAMRIEGEYVSTLSGSDREAYGEMVETRAAEAEAAIPLDVPAVLEILKMAPYSLGPTFVNAILAARGPRGINAAFRAPPTSHKQILTPSAYLSGDEPKPIAPPALTAAEARVGKPGTLGALGLYLMLAARVDPIDALPSIDAWAGDALVQFTRGTTACVRGKIAGAEPRDVDTIASGLEQWASLAPPGAVDVERAAGVVTFTSCDPGEAPSEAKFTAAASVLDARASALFVEIERGAPLDGALCVADQAPFDSNLRELLLQANPTEEEIGQLRAKITSLEAACGV